MECDCRGSWRVVTPSSSTCKIHNKVFSSNSYCPLYISENITPPSSSHGKARSKSGGVHSGFTTNSQPITSNSQGVHNLKRSYVRKVRDSVFERFHNYGVRFDAVVDWGLLDVVPVPLRNGVSYKRLEFDKGYVRVFRRSILVILRSKSEVVGLCAREAELVCRGMVDDILNSLPGSIVVSNRDVVSTHNAFVNHPVAKRDVNVVIDGEKRFISDNSKGYSEFEAVSPRFAVSDSELLEHDGLEKDFLEKDIRELVSTRLTREDIARALASLVDDRNYHAENLRSHVGAIRMLSDSVREFRDEVRRERLRNVRRDWGW